MPAKVLHLRQVQPAGTSPGATARPGDLVTWTDPKTHAAWPELLVEVIYNQLPGRLLVRGHFGRFATTGEDHIQSKPVLMADCVVTKRQGESA